MLRGVAVRRPVRGRSRGVAVRRVRSEGKSGGGELARRAQHVGAVVLKGSEQCKVV